MNRDPLGGYDGMTMSRRLLAALAATLALAAGAAGCSDDADDPGDAGQTLSVTAGPTASAAPGLGSSLSPAEFAAAAQRPDTVLLDVRTPEEYAEGHLEGAVLINLEDPSEFEAGVAELDPGLSYAVYCRTANRSAVAMDYLAQAGFGSYYDLAGGIEAWVDSGGVVVGD
jgi:phage shock protein E